MIELIILALLGILAVIDLRTKLLPSVFTSGLLFATALYQIVIGNYAFLPFLVLGFSFALTLYDGSFIKGIGDIKLIVLVSILISTIPQFLIFIGGIFLFGFTNQFIYLKLLKKNEGDEIAFVPVIFFSYMLLVILQYSNI